MHVHNFDAYNINWPLTWTRPWKTTKSSPFSENMPIELWSPTGAQSPMQWKIWFLTGRQPTGCIQHTKDEGSFEIWVWYREKKTASLSHFYNNKASTEFFMKTQMQAYVTEGIHSLNYYGCQLEKGHRWQVPNLALHHWIPSLTSYSNQQRPVTFHCSERFWESQGTRHHQNAGLQPNVHRHMAALWVDLCTVPYKMSPAEN